MKEFRVAEDTTEPVSEENHVPNGSSASSVACKNPSKKVRRAMASRYLLLGTEMPAVWAPLCNQTRAADERLKEFQQLVSLL
jgi:hypothetical protein